MLSKITTLEGDVAPLATDHRLASNPCQSSHGSTWEEEISKVSPLAGLMDVSVALTCVCDSCTQLCKDLPNPNNFHWWHDALSQMNNPTTK